MGKRENKSYNYPNYCCNDYHQIKDAFDIEEPFDCDDEEAVRDIINTASISATLNKVVETIKNKTVIYNNDNDPSTNLNVSSCQWIVCDLDPVQPAVEIQEDTCRQ